MDGSPTSIGDCVYLNRSGAYNGPCNSWGEAVCDIDIAGEKRRVKLFRK